MNFSSSTILIQLLAASSAYAAEDMSHVASNVKLLGGDDAAYPLSGMTEDIIFVANNQDDNSASGKKEYCYDEYDYQCYQ